MKITELLNESVVKAKTAYHATPKNNLSNILAHGLVPKKSPHDPGAKKQIYLFPSIDAADEALMNWLGDRFQDEDEMLSLLQIDVSGLTVFDDMDELYTTDPISPDRISVVDEHWG